MTNGIDLDVAMSIAIFIGGSYLLFLVTWIFYLAVMNLAPVRHELKPIAKVNGYILLSIGLVLDFVLNVVVCSVLFLKYPRDILLTGRLTRYINDPKERPWRRQLACWVCTHLLDQFDPKGIHCKRK